MRPDRPLARFDDGSRRCNPLDILFGRRCDTGVAGLYSIEYIDIFNRALDGFCTRANARAVKAILVRTVDIKKMATAFCKAHSAQAALGHYGRIDLFRVAAFPGFNH